MTLDGHWPNARVRLVGSRSHRLVDVGVDGPCVHLLQRVVVSEMVELSLDLHTVLQCWLRLLGLQGVYNGLHLLVVELLLTFAELVLELD